MSVAHTSLVACPSLQFGQTGLHIASLWGNVDAINVLIELGADASIPNSRCALRGGGWDAYPICTRVPRRTKGLGYPSPLLPCFQT